MKQAWWLASYPKSGNTWLRWFLSSYLADGSAVGLDDLLPTGNPAARQLIDRHLGIDSADLSREELAQLHPIALQRAITSGPDQRCWKTHAAAVDGGVCWLPQAVDNRLVLIVRDPRDVALSYAAFAGVDQQTAVSWLNDSGHRLPLYDRGIGPDVPVYTGSWSEHLRSWLGLESEKLLVLRYEDLHDSPHQAFTRLVRHLRLEPCEHRLARAIEATRFEQAAALESTHGFAEAPAGRRFFVAGRVGRWRDELAPELADRLLQAHGQTMRKMGYC